MFRSVRVAVLIGLVTAPLCRAEEPRELSNAELVRRARAAVAWAECEGMGSSGTAFCVRSDGVFVTNHHVFRGAPVQMNQDRNGPGEKFLRLVLNSGRPNAATYRARMLWTDPDWDLCILKVEGAKELAALPLATEEDLEGLRDVLACGYPLGKAVAIAGQDAPAMNINMGTVRSLTRSKGKLAELNLDVAINPGNSGGPVLDRKGRVVGVIYARVEQRTRGGFSLAVPVNRLQSMLSRPILRFRAPVITPDNTAHAVEFRTEVETLFPPREPLELSLILGALGGPGERRFPMERSGSSYVARASAFPYVAQRPGRVELIVIRHGDDLLEWNPVWPARAFIADREIKARDRDTSTTFLLSETGYLHVPMRGPAFWTARGRRWPVAPDQVAGILDSLQEQLPGFDPARLARLEVRGSSPAENDIEFCTVIATREGKTVASVSTGIVAGVREPPALRAIAEGRFLEPGRSLDPTTCVRIHFPADHPYVKVLESHKRFGDSVRRLPKSKDDPAGDGVTIEFVQVAAINAVGTGIFLVLPDWPRLTFELDPRRARVAEYEIKPPPNPIPLPTATPVPSETDFPELRPELRPPPDPSTLPLAAPFVLVGPSRGDRLYGRVRVWQFEIEGPHGSRVAFDFTLAPPTDTPDRRGEQAIVGTVRFNSSFRAAGADETP